MIHTSEQIDAISAALAKAQVEIENVEATGKNPAFKRDGKESRYATLGGVLDEVRPKLAAQGISVVQMAVNGEGSNIGIATRLLHSSGQWIESTLYVAPQQFTAQGAGSVITYLRRYCLMAMTGIAPEDDDGNAASLGAPAAREAPKAGMVRAADVPPQKTNGNGAPRLNNEHHPKRQEALDAHARIGKAIKDAQTPKVIDDIVKVSAADLEVIKSVNEDAYDRLMTLATNRKHEMYSDA